MFVCVHAIARAHTRATTQRLEMVEVRDDCGGRVIARELVSVVGKGGGRVLFRLSDRISAAGRHPTAVLRPTHPSPNALSMFISPRLVVLKWCYVSHHCKCPHRSH